MKSRRAYGTRHLAIAMVVGAISTGVLLVGGLGGETLARVQRSVAVDWRPAYDLVVLPEGVKASLKLGGQHVTEANFLGALHGGISIDQWQEVLGIAGVEVAAPVAPLGYFRRDVPSFYFPEMPTGFYEVRRTTKWDNGYEKRVQSRVAVGGPPGARQMFTTSFQPETHFYVRPYDNKSLPRFRIGHLLGFRSDDPKYIGEDREAWDPLGIDPGGVISVYGIDPIQESKLTGIDDLLDSYNVFHREVGLTESDVAPGFYSGKRFKPAFDLPFILNERGWIRTDLRIRWLRYRLSRAEIYELADLARDCPRRWLRRGVATTCVSPEITAIFESAGTEEIVDTRLPFSDALLGGEFEFRNGRWEQTTDYRPGLDADWMARPSQIEYRVLEDYPEGPWLGAVEALPTGSYGPEPTFRKQLPPKRNPLLSWQRWGTFDGSEIARRFSGRNDWLPEDTYRPPEATLRFDLYRDPREPTKLRPTANPLGYLLEPPRALTTLKAAAELVGDEPIGAIRVRVKGVEEPGEGAWTRVEDVARRIEEATGLQPIVTLGGSPARVLVRVPGITRDEQPSGVQAWRQPNFLTYVLQGKDRFLPARPARTVRGFGWVEERWLKQGAAIDYLRAGAAQHLWLVAVLGGSAAVYLVAAFASLALAEVRATAIRRAVGWTQRMVFARSMRHAFTLGLSGGALGVAAGYGIGGAFDLPVSAALAALALPVGCLLCCGAAVAPAWRASRLPLASVLGGGEVALVQTGTRRPRATALRMLGLAVIEVTRLRARVVLAVLAGVFASGSLLVLIGIRSGFGGSLQVTVMGQQILLETGPLQIGITALAAAMAGALLGEILWQSVIDRRREIGLLRAVGWARYQVAGLMVSQGVLLGLACALLGVAVSFAVLVVVLGSSGLVGSFGGAAAAAIAGGAALGLVASGLPAYRASRETPTDMLRSL